MNQAETAAKSTVETLVPGAIMHYRASQTAGEHDFDLEYPSGTKVPLEVTVSTDEAAEATYAAIGKSRRGGHFVPRVESRHDWYIHPVKNTNINRIRDGVDSFIAAIEAEGRNQFNAFTDSAESPAVCAILKELGIEQGRVSSFKSPGIAIAMPGDGGLVDPLLVNEAVETEAFKVDNRRKLGSTEGLERHLFVYVTRTRHVVWVAAREEAPPSVGLNLPPEITHVWMATWSGEGKWHTVWCARRGFPWTHMGQVNIATGEAGAVQSL